MKQDKDQYPFWRFWVKEVITREDGLPYLFRTTILGIGKFFSIKHHKVTQSDDACLHCHPWSFLSIILKGGYWEYTYETDQLLIAMLNSLRANAIGNFSKAPDGKWIHRKWHGPGSILWRPAPSVHKLELKEKNGKPVPCHTLVFTGKVFRKWGFYTKNGFIYWRNYTKQEHC